MTCRALRAVFMTALLLSIPLAAECRSVAPPRDISASSPGGTFRAEAKVLGNRTHQVDLKRMPAGDPVWSFTQDPGENWLRDVFVLDEGAVLLETRVGEYSLITPSGTRGEKFTLEAGLRGAKYNSEWNQMKKDVWREGPRAWFYFRTSLAGYVVVDVFTGALEQDPAVSLRMEEFFVNDARSWIRSQPSTFKGRCPGCGGVCIDPEVVQRLFIIRLYGMTEGEALVQAALEARDPSHDEKLKDELDAIVWRRAASRWGPLAALVLLGFASTWWIVRMNLKARWVRR